LLVARASHTQKALLLQVRLLPQPLIEDAFDK